MTGKYRIYINVKSYKEQIMFYMDIKRKITIICGDSAIGKTSICKAINNPKCNVFVKRFIGDNNVPKQSVSMEVLSPAANDAIDVISNHNNTIFVLDEDTFYYTKDRKLLFTLIEKTNNYFIIISRNLKFKGYKSLLYSVKEIYEITKDTSTISDSSIYKLKEINNSLYKVVEFFNFTKFNMISNNEVILVEDAGSGLGFYTSLFPNNKVYTVKGKANFSKFLIGKVSATDMQGNSYSVNDTDNLVMIPDGAAFGCELFELLEIIPIKGVSVRVLLPESFEQVLILCINNKELNKAVDNVYEYFDFNDTNNRSGSWEVYYTNLLIDYGKRTNNPYSKGYINAYYRTFIKNALDVLKNFECIEFNKTRSRRKYFEEEAFDWS